MARLAPNFLRLGSVAALSALLFGCSQTSQSSSAPGSGGTAGGWGGNGGTTSIIAGGGTAGGGTPSSQGGSGGASSGHEQAQKPAQETRKGAASSDCVSPFQNADLITADDAPRCDCKVGTVACLNNVQFLCREFWVGVPVTDCNAPNACVDLSGVTFKATALQTCQSGNGDYQCTWTIDFDANLLASYTIRRGLGPSLDGKFRCDGYSVVLEYGSTSTMMASYDPAAITLTLNGVKYVKQ
jgi:hypothetical protein